MIMEDNMKPLLIFYVLAFLLAILYIIKIFDKKNSNGKYLLKLSNRYILLIFLIVCLFFFINLLIFSIQSYLILNKNGDFMHITLSLIWVIISLSHVSKAVKYSEIREKGIYLENGFLEWNNIYCYEWMSPDTIKFKIKSTILSEYEEKVKVYPKDKDRIDEVLSSYVKCYSSNDN